MDTTKFFNNINRFLSIIKKSKNLDSKVISIYYILDFLNINKTLLNHNKQAKYIIYEIISDNYMEFEQHTFITDLGKKYYNLFVNIVNNIDLQLNNNELENEFKKNLGKYLKKIDTIDNADNRMIFCYFVFLYMLNNTNNLMEMFKTHTVFYTTVKNKIYEIENAVNNRLIKSNNYIYKKYKYKLLYTLKLLKEKIIT